MKKIVATLAIFSIIILGLNAQSDFRFGFEASPSFSWLKTDNNKINNNGTALGLRLGLMGEKYFTENYAITFGIGFAFNQGGKLSHDIGGNLLSESELSDASLQDGVLPDLPDGVNIKYGIQYIELPIGFKMRTQEFGYIKYYAELPRFALGIRSQARGDINGTYLDGEGLNAEKENIKQDVNILSLSWGLGIGAEYSLNENTAVIGGIYFQNSMFDITRNKGRQHIIDDKDTMTIVDDEIIDDPKEDAKATLGAITIRIGVIF